MNSTDEREASGNHSVHLCRTDFPFNQIVSTMLMKLDVGLAETSSRLYSYSVDCGTILYSTYCWCSFCVMDPPVLWCSETEMDDKPLFYV